MNTFSRLFASMAVCAACGWGAPVFAASHASFLHRQGRAVAAQTAQLESVSGRITAVTGNTFTIETSQGTEEKSGPKQIIFTIDQQTVVQGRITTGSKADVTFRREDKNNIAVSVRVSAT